MAGGRSDAGAAQLLSSTAAVAAEPVSSVCCSSTRRLNLGMFRFTVHFLSFSLADIASSVFGNDPAERLESDVLRFGAAPNSGVEAVDGGELLKGEFEVEDVEVLGDAFGAN